MNKKIPAIITVIVIGTLVGLHLFTKEDVWLCQNGQWIKHGDPGSAQPANGCGSDETSSAQALAAAYIRNHISELSPIKEALGGKFYVTSITFPKNGEALVDYEDGHIALQGKANYQMNNGQINVQSFINYPSPFTQTGNLEKNNPGLKENIWYLNYDLPGSPANLVELSFSSAAQCTVSATGKMCTVSALQAGEKVTITGELKDNMVEVGKVEKAEAGASTAEAIIEAISQKYNRPANTILIKVTADTGKFASGTINYADRFGGGLWFAAKTAKGWELAFDGNGIISCDAANTYYFPRDMVPQCIDTKNNNNLIKR